ncbi:MAG: 5-(carboxyamino)imidazole ribonucleotide synthase [Pseudomonadota bacterium]
MTLDRGATIGIVGGGQLAKMLSVAAQQLGFRIRMLAPPDSDAVGFGVAHEVVEAPYDDRQAFGVFARGCDVITYEFENIPFTVFDGVEVPVRPAPLALRASQDRLVEKAFLQACALRVARYAPVRCVETLDAAREHIPVGRLKTRRLGYDGRGQVVVDRDTSSKAAMEALGGAPAILEECVEFYAETSAVIARGVRGEIAAYDCPRNRHRDGILRSTNFPSPLSHDVQDMAQYSAESVARALGYVGVLAVEFFVLPDQSKLLVANEIAPRVHNTGHWTLDGAATSQFENHIRAIAGWPLGPSERTANVEMVNILGDELSGFRTLLANPVARPYIYGKTSARPGRKMGHVNYVVGSVDKSRFT